MGIIQRFKEGFAHTVEEEAIVQQKREIEAGGNVFLVMGDPIRGVTQRVVEGLQCALDPKLKSARAKEAEAFLAMRAFERERRRPGRGKN